jgi:hypothetical protein
MARIICFLLILGSTLILAPHAHAFEKLGIDWCDKYLARYEQCLRSMTYARCAEFAERRKLGRRYRNRIFDTPAAACVAEHEDLYNETNSIIRIFKRVGQAREFCSRAVRRMTEGNMRNMGCR